MYGENRKRKKSCAVSSSYCFDLLAGSRVDVEDLRENGSPLISCWIINIPPTLLCSKPRLNIAKTLELENVV